MGREGGVGAPALLRRGPPFCADAAPAVSMALPSDKAPPSFYSTAARRFAEMGGWGRRKPLRQRKPEGRGDLRREPGG